MQRGRVAGHGGQIRSLFGQMNIEIAADDHEECSLELIQKKCKLAGGADYDTGIVNNAVRFPALSLLTTNSHRTSVLAGILFMLIL